MRIATWNVERLKHNKDSEKMLAEIEKVAADILVLTETDERLKPDYPYCYKTPLLKYLKPDYYKAAENILINLQFVIFYFVILLALFVIVEHRFVHLA